MAKSEFQAWFSAETGLPGRDGLGCSGTLGTFSQANDAQALQGLVPSPRPGRLAQEVGGQGKMGKVVDSFGYLGTWGFCFL